MVIYSWSCYLDDSKSERINEEKMINKQVIGVIIFVAIVFSIFLISQQFYFDDMDLVKKKGDVTWAGHEFRIASSGNVEFVEDGYNVLGRSNSDDGLATSKLLDININQLIKVTVYADMKGTYVTGDWSEFGIYLAEKEDSFTDNKAGIALLGSRDHVDGSGAPDAGKNLRNEFSFEWFSIENTGDSIIFTDSWNRSHEEPINEIRKDDKAKWSIQPLLQNLDQSKEWSIRINSHVKGEGSTSLRIKDIVVEKL